jgi:hypothetical protein
MRILPLLAAPFAIALAFAAGAQDKPKAAVPAKPSTSITSKPAKAAAQSSIQLDSASQKALNERAGSKAVKPAAAGNAPGSERGYKSCHSDGSDA